MRKRTLGLLAALALCLGLLPGTALAVDTGVEIVKGNNRVILEAGKDYVADETNGGVKEVTEGEETPTDYLSYEESTLTVHGAVAVTCKLNVYSDLTITGGAGSSLDVTGNGPAICLEKPITLTLDGGVDFTARSAIAAVRGVFSGGSCFASKESYSGRIVLENTTSFPTAISIQYAALDLQNSASIELTRWLNYSSVYLDLVLKSMGDITITDVSSTESPQPRLTVEGNNVTVKSTGSNPAYMSHLDITARGNVEISSGGIPVKTVGSSYQASLAVHGAKSVSVTGASSDGNALFPVPVTFDNCESVTVTDTGSGEIPKEGVTVTSDCPWTATAGGKTVTIPSGTWEYGGEVPSGGADISSSVPIFGKIGEGWLFIEPPAEAGGTAVLTLDNVTYEGALRSTRGVAIVAKGENHVKEIQATPPVSVTVENGGTLNTLISQFDFEDSKASYTVYGKADLGSNTTLGEYRDNIQNADVLGSMTITQGAELTIPSDKTLEIKDLANLTNNGTIVNNGTVTLKETAAENVTSETVKSLGLTGAGTVTVEKTGDDGNPVIENYTNSGLKLLDPAGDANGTLDLSTADSDDATNWDTQGYKWENVEKDENNNITSGTLVLAEGFNAEKVILPDAAVEIVSKGECVIGTLTPPELSPGNAPANKTNLTFSGAGPLTVREFINISGGHENTLTVARDAVVIAENGITVCADGVVDGLVTVNGTLIAENSSGAALRSGNVVVSGSGTLKVSGDTGVVLGGKSGQDFNGAFTIQPGGRLEADCTNNAVEAHIGVPNATFEGREAADILVIPDGYLPQGREPEFNGNKTSLFIPGGEPFNISSDNVPPDPDPVPAHVHLWAEEWTAGETHHWHECAAAGCPVRENSGKYGYEEHRYDDDQDGECNVCGYRRTLTPSGGGSSGRGGGGGSSVAYAITVEKTAHGKVTSSRASAGANSAVTLTVSPSSGYALDALTVTDSQGGAVTLTAQSARKYLFTMPGRAVTVRAIFVPLSGGGQTPCDGGADCPSRGFADLGGPEAWYHEAVDYVLERGLMGGYGDGLFGPDNRLTRAQFAQILYNQAGRPAVTGTLPFTDVAPDAWCAPAVAWAAERGIAGGYGGGLFGPDDAITREQLAVMLWRYAGSPAAPGGDPGFTDAEQIAAHAREAVRWAAQAGVMNGKTGGALDPKGPATRAQAASMLKNYLEDG